MRRVLVLACAALLGGCASFRTAGRNVVGGALDELERRGGAQAITKSAVSGARDELTNEESQKKLRALEAAMMEQMTLDAAKLRQELLGEAFRADIERARAEFLEKTRHDLNRTRDELVGVRLHDAMGRVADRIVGDVTREHLGLLRDEILGEKSRVMTHQLVEQAGVSMQHQMDLLRIRLENDKKALNDELRRTLWGSATFIAILGTAVLVLAAAVRRSNRIIAALAEPLRHTRDDALTRQIVDRAKELGVSALVKARLARRVPPGEGEEDATDEAKAG